MANYRTISGFVKYCILAIVANRGIYDAGYFIETEWNGIVVTECLHPELQTYLAKVVSNLKSYMTSQSKTSIVFALYDPEPSIPLVERWQFDIQKTDNEDPLNMKASMAMVLNQIKSSESYAPLLTPKHLFRVLLYTQTDLPVTSDCFISQDQQLKSRAIPMRGVTGEYNVAINLNLKTGQA